MSGPLPQPRDGAVRAPGGLKRRRFLGLLPALLALGQAPGCAPIHNGPVSDHFDGSRFFNPGHQGHKGFADLLKWRLGRKNSTPWPENVPNTRFDPPPAHVQGAALRVTNVGHSTVLVQTAGVNILTDPVWSETAGPFGVFGPRRSRQPGLPLEVLPRIDAVLVSHNHYDHLDTATLGMLAGLPQTRDALVLAPLGNAGLISQAAPTLAVREMDWGHEAALAPGVRVHAAPALHWSARGLSDRRKALWASFVIEAPGGNVYFCGDSAYGRGEVFRQARERFGGFRLALLPIGAYEPRWFMSSAHMNPEEAVLAMKALGAARAMATHHGVFKLSDEGMDKPAEDLAAALETHGVLDGDFRAVEVGEAWDVS